MRGCGQPTGGEVMVEVEDDSASIRSHASDQQGAFLQRRIFRPYSWFRRTENEYVCVLSSMSARAQCVQCVQCVRGEAQ